MRNYRILMMSVAMLMASMSMMAQRVTTVLKGTGLVGMYGFPCTLTVTPEGNGIIKGEATKEVGAVTVKFKAAPNILFELPTINAGQGMRGDGFQWAYIKDITVSSFTMQKTTITPTGQGKFNGTTGKEQAKFYVRFPMRSDKGQSALDINFTFSLENVAKKVPSSVPVAKKNKGLEVIR